MDKIRINVSKPYDVIIGDGLISKINELSYQLLSGKRALVVAGSNIAPTYGKKVAEILNCQMFVHPTGEASKNIETAEKIIIKAAETGLNRDDYLIAVGGGVTGDLTAFAASIYMRGINYIHIPTTVLAAVDSSVGGKTAVDINNLKNLAGTFYQPSLVIVDTDCFSTLPKRIYNEGMAEVIKYSYLCGADLTSDENMVYKCIDTKRKLVEQDEFDYGQRRLLNFGHTLGHAIEALSNYSLLHGESVAIGMAYMCRAFDADYDLLCRMLEKYDLPVSTSIDMSRIIEKARMDKKGGFYAVPYKFGDVRIEKIDLCKLK